MLRRWANAWEPDAARAVIAFLAEEAARERDNRHTPTLRFLMRAFARQCPPSLASYAAATLAGRPAGPVWQTSANQFITTLALRREIHLAVTSDE